MTKDTKQTEGQEVLDQLAGIRDGAIANAQRHLDLIKHKINQDGYCLANQDMEHIIDSNYNHINKALQLYEDSRAIYAQHEHRLNEKAKAGFVKDLEDDLKEGPEDTLTANLSG